MTTRTKDLLTTIGAAITAGVFGAGVIWGGTRAEIGGKLEADRFVADSISRVEREKASTERIGDALIRIEHRVNEINQRVTEIACPPNARGCR